MIKNIIFDFGDVFINLDKQVVFRAMNKTGNWEIPSTLQELNNGYEIGKITSEAFIAELQNLLPNKSSKEIITIWNSMLLDFPDHRLEFIERLANEKKYRLFLLSNTNALHIPHVAQTMGDGKFIRFKNSFEQFYLSHEIGLRKPNEEIFNFVLDENNLIAQETLFIDDSKENTDAAACLGINIWNLKVGIEDVVNLSTKL